MRWVIANSRNRLLPLSVPATDRLMLFISRSHRIDGTTIFGIYSTIHLILPMDYTDDSRCVRTPQYGVVARVRASHAVGSGRFTVYDILSAMSHCNAWWPAYGTWNRAFSHVQVYDSSRGERNP